MNENLTMSDSTIEQTSPLRPGSTLVIATHRPLYGYAEIKSPDDELTPAPTTGGLVTGLQPLMKGKFPGVEVISIGVAHTSGDRAAGPRMVNFPGGTPFEQRFVCPDPAVFSRAHRFINLYSWNAAHGMFDKAGVPSFSDINWKHWTAFQQLNYAIAEPILEIIQKRGPENVTVWSNDLQLDLVPGLLKSRYPSLGAVHFQHIPELRDITKLPWDIARELAWSMASAPRGFHYPRWVDGCMKLYRDVIPEDVEFFEPFACPLPADLGAVHELAAEVDAPPGYNEIMKKVGGRRIVLIITRIEKVKNVDGTLAGCNEALETDWLQDVPEYLDDVAFVFMVQPTREDLDWYREYRLDFEKQLAAANQKWAERGHREPFIYHPEQNRGLAAKLMQQADVAIHNPLSGGNELTALEMMSFFADNERTLLVLSENAGVSEILGDSAISVDPYDPKSLPIAIKKGLDTQGYGRFMRGRLGVERSRAMNVDDWCAQVLSHVEESIRLGPEVANGAQMSKHQAIPATFTRQAPDSSWDIGLARKL